MSSASPPRLIRPGALAWLPFAFAATLYLPSLFVGALGDDFLFLGWADQGLGEILRRVTVASDPRMIRPWPALVWWLSGGTPLLLHAISIALHGICATLVARIAARLSARAGAGLLAGLAFAAAPIFAEPVVWLSASFDLWATAAALAAVLVALRGGRLAVPAAVALFALALASKESAATLPLLLLLLAPRDPGIRRAAAWMTGLAVVYLALRFALFRGLGGYAVDGVASAIPAVDPLFFLRNALLQIPFRLAWGVKAAASGGPVVLALTIATAAALASALSLRDLAATALRIGAVWVVALAPAFSVLSIDVDHEGARLAYLPIAFLAVAAGAAAGATRRARTPFAAALVALWATVTVVNQRSWLRAAELRDQTLALLESSEPAFSAGDRVFVDAPDSVDGAYVWRNALVAAARRYGLRQDLDRVLGSSAEVPRPDAAGDGRLDPVFSPGFHELRVAPGEAPGDVTGCVRAVRSAGGGARSRAPYEAGAHTRGRTPAGDATVEFRLTRTAPAGEERDSGRFVRIDTGTCGADDAPIPVAVEWRASPAVRWRFSSGTAAVLASDAETWVRVPARDDAGGSIDFRIRSRRELPSGCVERIALVGAPPVCRRD